LIFNLDSVLPGCVALYRRMATEPAGGDVRERWAAAAESALVPLAGASERLAEWERRYALGVIAPMPLKVAGEWIKWGGWRGLFRVLVGEEHVNRGWPGAVWYSQAAERLRCPAAACLGFDSTVEGVRAAREAGVAVVGIGGGVRFGGRMGMLAGGAATTARDWNDGRIEAVIRGARQGWVRRTWGGMRG
jgi:beta-phosphoglucomutase-like phosphatase (HAD superfamily)